MTVIGSNLKLFITKHDTGLACSAFWDSQSDKGESKKLMRGEPGRLEI